MIQPQKKSRPWLCLAAGLAVVAACSSDPARFYTLIPPASPEARKPSAPYAFELLPVSLPAQVDVPQIVVRESDGEVMPVESRQWIAPLADEFRGALSSQLASRLSARDVYRVSAPAGAKVYRIKVDVRRFDSRPGRSAELEAVWSVRARGAEPELACSTRASRTVGAGFDALVEGHQQAVAQLAAQIAAAVEALGAGRAAACPD